MYSGGELGLLSWFCCGKDNTDFGNAMRGNVGTR